MARWLIALCVWLVPGSLLGHALTSSNLQLNVGRDAIDAQWAIALRDLDAVLGLDMDGDASITEGELRERRAAIADYARARVEIKADGRWCRLTGFEPAPRGAQIIVRFAAHCPAGARRLELRYDLFFEHDPAHQGLLRLTQAGRSLSRTFTAGAREQSFALDQSFSPWADLLAYVRQGVWHIWLGFDHILFLLVLLLPAVVERARDDARSVLLGVVKIVTSFTLAHSSTLALAAFQLVNPPARWIEAAIAGSVLIVALRNLGPRPARHSLGAAFAFGLIHGFGFANVLSELGLPRGAFARCLLGFNLGVELGQLCLVAAFLPLAFLARNAPAYRSWGVRRGSLLVAAIAALLVAERVLDVPLFEGALRALSPATRQQQELSARADAERLLASRLARAGDLRAAGEHHAQAAILFGELGDAASEADNYSRVGDLALARAELPAALRAYRQALDVRERLGDVRGALAQYHNLHLAARVRGDLTEAAQMLRRALDAAHRAGLRELVARHSAELGKLYRETDQLSEAAAALERAVAITETSGDDVALAEQLEELGNIYNLSGELARAASTYGRALALKEALGRSDEAADIHANSADVARRQGRQAEAIASYQRALALYAAVGQKRKAQRVITSLTELGGPPVGGIPHQR